MRTRCGQVGDSFRLFRLLFLAVMFLLFAGCASTPVGTGEASVGSIELGEEYVDYNKSSASSEPTILSFALWYLPNRIFDALDIVRADVGVGPAFGAVARITEYGQAGYRSVSPASLRVGLRGRNLPVFIERSSEFGAGPAFLQSHDREVTPLEIGVGADLFLVGAYLGASVDEFFDFVAGFIGIDFKEDDIS